MRVSRLIGLPPEDLATLLASWARSDQSVGEHADSLRARGLIGELSPAADAAAPRTERQSVLDAYGHPSAGEHAVVHLACEGITLAAAHALFDCRLGSYTEKSGQFRPVDALLVPPPAGLSDEDRARFVRQVDRLAAARAAFQGPLIEHLRLRDPVRTGETPAAATARHEGTVRTLLRHLVPFGAQTDLCITANARVLGGLLIKLASSLAREQRALAAALDAAARPALPNLLRPTIPSAYRKDTDRALASWAAEFMSVGASQKEESNRATLVRAPDDVEQRLVAALLYRHTDHGHRAVASRVAALDHDTRKAVIDEALRRRGRHDGPPRELEHVQYSFDVLLDGGALREVERHRLTSRTPQELTVSHGYVVEPELIDAGLGDEWCAVLDDVAETIESIATRDQESARLLIPLGFRQRSLITWNLRALHQFVQLRSRRNGNRAVRAIALDVYREVERAQPLVARSMHVEPDGSGGP